MKVEKQTAEFTFTVEYQSDILGIETVKVILVVDYQCKIFSILPDDYGKQTKNDKFMFVGASQNYRMWKAVLDAIKYAIDFGNNEINSVSEL